MVDFVTYSMRQNRGSSQVGHNCFRTQSSNPTDSMCAVRTESRSFGHPTHQNWISNATASWPFSLTALLQTILAKLEPLP
jgi:hypothetical protein